MSDVVVEKVGLFQRLMSAFKGIVVGLILMVVAVPFMFWNEWTAVSAYQALQEGAGLVVSVPADQVDTSNDSKLVHVVGDVAVTGALKDPVFGVSASDSLRLRRTVEMYQWKENKKTKTEKKVGGGEERVTTYSYEQVWSDKPISSSSFNDKAKMNPTEMPHASESFEQKSATLGAFELDGGILRKFSNFEPMQVSAGTLSEAQAAVRDIYQVHGGNFYKGNPSQPAIGDVRVRFERAPASRSTIVGMQAGKGFSAYKTNNGRELLFVRLGEVSSEKIFDDAISNNTLMTWAFRFVAFLMIFGGIRMLFGPIAVITDIVPFAGRIVRAGISVVSFLVAAPVSLLIIAVAWIFARPLLGIALLLLGAMFMAALAGLIVMVTVRSRSDEAAAA